VHTTPIGWILIGLAVVAALVQAGTARLLIRRKLRTEFPIFFNYCVFGVVMVAISLVSCIFTSCRQYFYLYWVLSFLFMALEFGIMYEIFTNALKPYSALIDLGKMLFRWAGVFLLFAAILTAVATSGPQANKVNAAIALLEHSMRLMQCGFLFLFFLFERKLGLSWKNHNMSIALGMGVTAAVDLSASYLKAHFPASASAFFLINSLLYLGVLSFWYSSLAQPAVEPKNVLESPSRLIFQRWNEALTTYTTRGELALAPGSMDSFLPGVEQTVDRVLARKMVQ